MSKALDLTSPTLKLLKLLKLPYLNDHCHGDSINRDSSTVMQRTQAYTIGSLWTRMSSWGERVEVDTSIYICQGLTEPLTRSVITIATCSHTRLALIQSLIRSRLPSTYSLITPAKPFTLKPWLYRTKILSHP